MCSPASWRGLRRSRCEAGSTPDHAGLILSWAVDRTCITNALATGFVDWLAAETGARGLAYLDLHDLLTSDEFLDSMHVSRSGHRRIANAIAPVLERMLEQRRAWAPVARSDR